MAFKYINPGYAELLSVSGGTTVTGEQYSKTGISFWQPTSDKGLTISEFPAELYGKLVFISKHRRMQTVPNLPLQSEATSSLARKRPGAGGA